MSYQDLESEQAVDDLLGGEDPCWIYKHSSTCGISLMAKEQVDQYLADHPEETVAMVVVQTHRPVSNHIAERLGQVHQSPQLFLVKGGEVRWSASHYGITADKMAEARKAAA